jgi:myo-inositol 2-dehydrogenase/D-chiro-inositol 1-dehydrogenase
MSLKIGVAGTGNVAMRNYLPHLASQPDVELAYYNRTAEKAERAAAQFGGRAFATLAELAAWEPTTVLVLTSEKGRYEAGMELINQGARRIFFEKPLVAMEGQAHVTEDDYHKGKAMLDLARERGCETAMVFNYRFFDQTLAAKRIAAERNFGEVTNAIGLVHYACWSHAIDLIHHFAGNVTEITALSGAVSRHSSEVQIDATDVTAAFRMENGATGTIIGTAGMKWQHPLYELTFNFEGGRLHMRDLDGSLEILDGAGGLHETHALVRHTSRWDQYAASFIKSLEAYLQALRSDSPPPIPGLDGLRELQVEAALKRSIAEHRPVRVQEEFPLV